MILVVQNGYNQRQSERLALKRGGASDMIQLQGEQCKLSDCASLCWTELFTWNVREVEV